MKILAIETSCDETAVCILETNGDLETPRIKILGNALQSQIELHQPYGGVYPSLAKREHAKNLVPLTIETLKQAEMLKRYSEPLALSEQFVSDIKKIFSHEPLLGESFLDLVANYCPPNELDALAVTVGPGLEPALWTGINLAKALSKHWKLPVFPVDHMAGHLASVWLPQTEESSTTNSSATADNQFSDKLKWPAVALLVSGGHTELVLVNNWSDIHIIGQTRDDAAGEAFDKVARLLELPYPGGPEISKLAQKARDNDITFTQEFSSYNISPLPRPMLNSGDRNFSFSGLKTAVLYRLNHLDRQLTDRQKQAMAREFEDAVIEVLTTKTRAAAEEFAAHSLIAAGGVIANGLLRKSLQDVSTELECPLLLPQLELSTDNAVMIGIAAFLNKLTGQEPVSASKLTAQTNISFPPL